MCYLPVSSVFLNGWLRVVSNFDVTIFIQLSRERKNFEEKLHETHASLEQEENKAKQEHRQRIKLEQIIAELEESLSVK